MLYIQSTESQAEASGKKIFLPNLHPTSLRTLLSFATSTKNMANILITKPTKNTYVSKAQNNRMQNWKLLFLPCLVSHVTNCTLGATFNFQILSQPFQLRSIVFLWFKKEYIIETILLLFNFRYQTQLFLSIGST